MQSRVVRSTKSAGLVPQSSETSPWHSPNNITTFVRCLRLLDLDRLADWPSITENVFATKPAQQNLQARIKAIEWSLYRLFEIYNPKETQTKLRPFFPPLAPLQSLNLRAALYRTLTELKKNGVLGRDVVLRKIMLDECKGEKFEEVISTLALVVLRHACRSRHPDLDLEQLDQTPKEQLLPMIIAYRQSLQQSLQQHRAISKHAKTYSAELQAAQADIRRRMAQAQTGFQPVEEKDLRHLSEVVRRAWIGDERIADILLQGRTSSPSPLLRTPFEFSWLAAIDHESSLNDKQNNLAAELEARVEEQEHRLKKWKSFHASIKNTGRADIQPQKSRDLAQDPPGIDFGRHRKLRFDSSQSQQVALDQIQPYHASVLRKMREELDALTAFNPAAKPSAAMPHLNCTPAVHHGTLPRTPDSIGSARNTPIQDQAIVSSTEESTSATSATHYERELDTNTSVEIREFNINSAGHVDMEDVDVSPAIGDSFLISDQAVNRTIIPSSPSVVIAAVDELPPCHEAELERTPNVTPGAKRDFLPTLHERTRASLLPFTLKLSSPDIDDQPTAGDSRSETSQLLPALPDLAAPRGTLLERTRQSMSLLPKSPPKTKGPRHSMKQPRFSEIFPVNQFETPSKSQVQQSGARSPRSGSSTPRDRLFSEEADYASVFKSRPRIAVSPSLSPERSDLSLESMLTTSGDELELEDTAVSPSRCPINYA